MYNVWPYPPAFFLILAPLAMLPYVAAFLIFDLVTLLGYVSAVVLDRATLPDDSSRAWIAIYLAQFC